MPANRAIEYSYNNLSQKTEMILRMSGSPVHTSTYNYFANGWLKNVQSGGSTVASYSYDFVGNRTRVDFGNGTWQSFGYKPIDPRYMLENIHYAYRCNPTDPITDNGGLKFTRDNSGNPLNWGDITDTYTRVYAYDKNSRLDTVTYPGSPTVDFTYDWVGNRTNPSGLQYNAADQLTAWPGQHIYDYQGTGSLSHKYNDTGERALATYEYSPANLLERVSHFGVGFANTMLWDAAGNRVHLTTTAGPIVYEFVYDVTAGTPAVVEEVAPTGSVYYVRDPGGALICREEGTTTQYYHFDDLGSTLFLTGSDGTVTDKYTYDAWGNLTSHTGNTLQPYQYVGGLGYYTHYQDVVLGLLQLGVRFYDPQIGRFTQRDPVGDTRNSYGYGAGNPVNMLDPQGLTAVSAAQYSKIHPSGVDMFVGFDDVWEVIHTLAEYVGSMTPAEAMAMGMCPDLGAAEKILAKPRAIKISPRLSKAVEEAIACGRPVHQMHLCPQAKEFQPHWDRTKIDIERYKIPMPKDWHILKPNGCIQL